MSTPYDEAAPFNRARATARIRELNDALRAATEFPLGPDLASGQLVVTRGVAEHGNEFIDRAVRAVQAFDAFSEDNDPHGEHDFGSFELDGETLFWKIDYYDSAFTAGSPDPADPGVTRRVLTILLAEEY
jgi:hypothetical protein